MAITRSATARYQGTGKDGVGSLTTQSGVLQDQRYGFQSRFEDGPGTNPEELIAAAHAGCFTMALSFALAKEGITDARLETTARVKLEQDGEGFAVTRSDLALTADVPNLDEDRLRALAGEAEKNCPISKLLKAEIGLTVTVGAGAAA
ncbi:MAG: lipoyl-dependent peroxiredoxin [Thermoleophilaceae bacterium]|nr:lipoyl-dependent peroxiredoxin [Thermoleophilaceae bacterium]